jgi:nitrite reductase (NO-forming)
VRPRPVMRAYQGVARAWLSAAALSLLLPESSRLGVWLPLHLAVAGAVSTAIGGAMQTFAAALTATASPPQAAVWTQLAAVTAGAGLIAVGYPSGHPALVAVGGTSFVLGMALLGWFVLRAWARALNRRHAVATWTYLGAVSCVLAGGGIGALLGSGSIHDPGLWLRLRSAHMALNVLGFASGTIVATLVTLLPTVLRVQMPRWHAAWTSGSLLAGAALLAAGFASSSEVLGAAGALLVVGAAGGTALLVARVLSTPRTWPAPLAAKHMVAGVAWFAIGSVALAVAVARGEASFLAFREPFLAVFVCGWVLQVLLGAWLYLLPMARPGHPDERRRQLSAVELGGTAQVLGLNAGVALLALRAAGWVPSAAGAVGAGLALGAGGVALLKAWIFPTLGRARAFTRRERAVWGA